MERHRQRDLVVRPCLLRCFGERMTHSATLIALRLVSERGDHQLDMERMSESWRNTATAASRENRREMARDPLPCEALMAKLDRYSSLQLRQDRLVEHDSFGEIGLFGWRFLASPSRCWCHHSPTLRHSFHIQLAVSSLQNYGQSEKSCRMDGIGSKALHGETATTISRDETLSIPLLCSQSHPFGNSSRFGHSSGERTPTTPIQEEWPKREENTATATRENRRPTSHG